MIKEGDFVLVDKDACYEFKRDSDYFAIVEYIDDYCQVQLINGTLYDIERVESLHKIDKSMLKFAISEARQFTMEEYYTPNLQLVIDVMEEFGELLFILEDEDKSEFDKKTALGSMSYRVDTLMEVFTYERKSDWSCIDVELLENMYTYIKLLEEIL